MRGHNFIIKAIFACLSALLLFSGMLQADERAQAIQLFTRLNGVPPSPEKIAEIESLLQSDKLRAAAMAAINDPNGNFYNIVLKQFVAPWTNEDSSVRVPLNDYIATAVGMIRDDVPFNQFLYEDILYVGESTAVTLPAYDLSDTDNSHYSTIEQQGLKLHDVLVRKKQSELTNLPPDATAGVFTTWGFAKDFYNGGTNRVAVRFTLKTFMCKDIDGFADNTRPDFRVRRDVTRTPAGDPALFRGTCSGCHAGMDALGGAFAYVDYNPDADVGQTGLLYDATSVVTKMNRNETEFPQGYITTDDTWINNWLEGANADVGWNGATSGRGLKSYGKMFSSTEQFATCMAEKVLVAVCGVNPNNKDVRIKVNAMANSFKANGQYNMKYLFAQSALMCRGE